MILFLMYLLKISKDNHQKWSNKNKTIVPENKKMVTASYFLFFHFFDLKTCYIDVYDNKYCYFIILRLL